MNTRIVSLFCLALIPTLGGCATTGVKPTNPAVMRKFDEIDKRDNGDGSHLSGKQFHGVGLRPTVMLDGHDFVNVGNGRVFVGAFRPGHYVFEMDDKKSGTELNLAAGQTVYMKMEIVPGFWKGGGRLLQMAPEQGAFEAKRLELMPSQVRSKSHLTDRTDDRTRLT